MFKKIENTPEEYANNISKVSEIIKDNSKFFFYFSPDPDAVGVSIAFSLYLRQKNKECFIFLPEGFDPNLDFLFEITSYNKIKLLKDVDKVYDLLVKKSPLFIVPDTPTKFLLPHFKEINELKEKFCPKESIEIDHHFGGDSEKIFENSVSLLLKANSCCEILADFFDKTEKHLDLIFPRNIVLSLLVGICFDTQFGKFVTNKENYDKWFIFLSERLKSLTWANPKYLKSSQQIFDSINKMSDNKVRILDNMIQTASIIKKVGLLIIPQKKMNESLSPSGDSTCILSKVISDLSNVLPEISGSIGILAFYNDIEKLYFMKIRRSYIFKDYDLRELESLLTEIFGNDYIGGGGHPGAVSFRFADINRNEFIEKVEELQRKIITTILNAKIEK